MSLKHLSLMVLMLMLFQQAWAVGQDMTSLCAHDAASQPHECCPDGDAHEVSRSHHTTASAGSFAHCQVGHCANVCFSLTNMNPISGVSPSVVDAFETYYTFHLPSEIHQTLLRPPIIA